MLLIKFILVNKVNTVVEIKIKRRCLSRLRSYGGSSYYFGAMSSLKLGVFP